MKDLLTYILNSIVDYPGEIKIEESETEDGFVALTVHANPSDMGKIIGKDGRIIKAIRSLVRVVAIRENKKVSVEIADNESSEHADDQQE